MVAVLILRGEKGLAQELVFVDASYTACAMPDGRVHLTLYSASGREHFVRCSLEDYRSLLQAIQHALRSNAPYPFLVRIRELPD
jgi:hypothetical protein